MGNKFYRLIDRILELSKKLGLKEKLNNFFKAVLKITDKLRTKGLTKKQTIVISSLLILSLVIILWPTKNIQSPETALNRIEQAIVDGNTNQVIHLVDIEAISKDLSAAILNQLDSQSLAKDLLAYMQKDVETKITEDFYNIVDFKGDFMRNIKNADAVLSKSLNFLFNKSGKIISREVISLEENKAVVEIIIYRPDLDKEIPIYIELFHNDIDWALVKVKNLDQLLKTLEELEEQRVAKLNEQIRNDFNNFVILKDFQKSNLNIKDNSFLIRLSLENISNEDIKELEGTLNITTASTLLGTVDIKIPETIYANNFYEKAWNIKLSNYKSLSKLARISSKNVKASLNIEKIVFAKGKVIELIK